MTDTVDDPGTRDGGAGVDGGAGSGDDAGAGGPGGAGGDGSGVDSGDLGPVPGRTRVGLIVSLVVGLLAVAFVGVLATREPATERRSSSPLIGKVTPALSGATLDGGSFDIDDHQSQWVVVNFFATWCPPCVEEHPELVAFSDAHRATGDAVVVSVVYNESPDRVRDFFLEQGGDWPVIDDGGRAAVDYGVVKVPETYLVAPGGTVVQKYTGGVTRDMIERDIAAVTAANAEPVDSDPAAGGS